MAQVPCVDEMFPMSAAANKAKYHWICFRRRGNMMICMGADSGERGIPRPGSVLRKVNAKNVSSLHEFMCLAESLWAEVL